VRLRDALNDRQAQPRALLPGGVPALQNRPSLFLRNARPVVLDEKPARRRLARRLSVRRGLFVRQGANRDRDGLASVLDGVAEEVLQKPPEPSFVALEFRGSPDLKRRFRSVDVGPGLPGRRLQVDVGGGWGPSSDVPSRSVRRGRRCRARRERLQQRPPPLPIGPTPRPGSACEPARGVASGSIMQNR
jgi:hypothetical protein